MYSNLERENPGPGEEVLRARLASGDVSVHKTAYIFKLEEEMIQEHVKNETYHTLRVHGTQRMPFEVGGRSIDVRYQSLKPDIEKDNKLYSLDSDFPTCRFGYYKFTFPDTDISEYVRYHILSDEPTAVV